MRDWRRYTPDELRAQYDNRAAVPEHPAILGGWAARSQALRAGGYEARLDLPYGPHPRQRLDLFLPARRPARLHVFVHGGYWQALGKESSSFVAEGLLQAGLAVAVVGYRLCPEVSVAAIAEDVRAACRWLHGNASAFGADGSRIQVSGHSAGGHLLGLLWATDWSAAAPVLPPDFLHSGLALSGLFDLEPLVHTPVNEALGLDAETARRLSPALLEPRSRAPLALAVGSRESREYRRQSQILAAAWESAGVPVETCELSPRDHFTIVDELAAPTGALCRRARELWA